MKLKIDRKEALDTDDLWPYLEVKISKFKVTSPINAVTKKAIFAERWGLRTSNLVQRLSTMTRITDMRGDIQSENEAVQVTTCGGERIVAATLPLQPHNLLWACAQFPVLLSV